MSNLTMCLAATICAMMFSSVAQGQERPETVTIATGENSLLKKVFGGSPERVSRRVEEEAAASGGNSAFHPKFGMPAFELDPVRESMVPGAGPVGPDLEQYVPDPVLQQKMEREKKERTMAAKPVTVNPAAVEAERQRRFNEIYESKSTQPALTFASTQRTVEEVSRKAEGEVAEFGGRVLQRYEPDAKRGSGSTR